MYPFSPSVTPAVRSHLDAQVAFVNDLSKSLSRSFQSMVELNLQLGQSLLEETTTASQQLLTADRATDAISSTASHAQPVSEKLRAYQQHISRVAADAQVDIARVAEQHVQNTSRTARALADEVKRVATEESEQSKRQQEDSVKNFRDPFQHSGSQRGNGSMHAHGNLQSADQTAGDSAHFEGPAGTATFEGNVQGERTAQPGSKGGSKAN
ncbi:MAG TPA: phasin family protein [Duganella sp.]|jgi:phasin family protein